MAKVGGAYNNALLILWTLIIAEAILVIAEAILMELQQELTKGHS